MISLTSKYKCVNGQLYSD